ncbi:hypothetical protein NVP1205O_34 [Vibrio phage 1.205.O._10N.222.51.A7]|nr:hypothetical protein NVP1205O_34 [Vibrio phage 1.205.O._10N.222.51.A7]QZI91329.1 hypothetical protein PODOV033v1_p0022 [Vibrio phage 252E42.2]
MPDAMRALIGSQNRLQELLECSRTQAWRIWSGKTKLTAINEKYLWRVLEEKSYDGTLVEKEGE